MGSENVNPIPVVVNFVVRKSGILDFDGLFEAIKTWFDKYSYDAVEKAHTEDKKSTGTYIEAKWEGKRNVTPYVQFIIRLQVLLRDMTDVLVEMPDGKKIKKNKARLELVFDSKMEKNYDEHLSEEKGKFTNFLKMIYEKYIAKSELEKYEDKLYVETQDFIDTLKGYFD